MVASFVWRKLLLDSGSRRGEIEHGNRGLPANLLRFFELFDEGWNDLKKVANYAIVGHLEDRRVLILVDGSDGARPLHPHHVLNRAADSQGEVELWRHRLPGAADLPVHREPAFVANRPRRANFSAEQLCQLLRHRDILWRFDSAPDRHQN